MPLNVVRQASIHSFACFSDQFQLKAASSFTKSTVVTVRRPLASSVFAYAGVMITNAAGRHQPHTDYLSHSLLHQKAKNSATAAASSGVPARCMGTLASGCRRRTTTEASSFSSDESAAICSTSLRTLLFIMVSNASAVLPGEDEKSSCPAFSHNPSSSPIAFTSFARATAASGCAPSFCTESILTGTRETNTTGHPVINIFLPANRDI